MTRPAKPASWPRLAAVACGLFLFGMVSVAMAQPPVPSARHSGMNLDAGSGQVVTLPGAATNIFVADPKVVEVRPASATSLFVFGVGMGGVWGVGASLAMESAPVGCRGLHDVESRHAGIEVDQRTA